MSRRRHLFRIQERAAGGPARRRPGDRQPRHSSGASRRPIAACCTSAASSASFAAGRYRRSPRQRAASGRTPSPSPRSSTRTCSDPGRPRALVLPCQPRVAGLAPDARRDASATTSSTAKSVRPVSREPPFVPRGAMARIEFPARFPTASPTSRRSPREVARGSPACFAGGSVRDLRSAAAQRAPRRHDGDRRQGPVDHRRDQGQPRRPGRRRKWTDYLDYCDRFYWAVPAGARAILDEERFLPGEPG